MKKLFNIFLLLTVLSGAGFSQTDIELTYSSFLGGSGEDSGGDIVELSDNKYLIFGGSFSNDMPLTDNAFLSSTNNGIAATYFAVFLTNGELEYASYLENEGATIFSAATDLNDRIFLAGSAFSSGFPLLNAANENFGEIPAGFISCFSSDFNLEWSTYFGGTESDVVSAITIDNDGNIYAVGNTTSPDMGTAGVHMSELHPASTTSGFVSKVNPDGEIIWYSYISGTGNSVAENLILSADGSTVYVSGTVGDSPDHGFTNSFQDEPGGGSRDCILLAYATNDGTMEWGTYYGGEGFDNNSYVNVLDNGNIVFTGTTGSDEGIATNGSFQSERMGSNDHFLTAFSPQGERLWATYFGGSQLELISEVDVAGNSAYLSGATFSPNGISLGNPILEEIDGSFNIASYIAKFDEFGSPQWATFLNENYSCAITGDFFIAQDGTIYGKGVFNSNGNSSSCLEHISPDAYQPFYGGGNGDIGIFHYQENFLSTTFPQAEPLTIYPNPAQDRVTIEAPNLLWAGMELTVTDMSGRQIDRVARFQSGNAYSTSHLSEGVYILTGQIGERMFRQKLVVQR